MAKYTEFDPQRDYTKDLQREDIREENGREFVYLRGLEKLARARGVKSARVVKLEQMTIGNAEGATKVNGVILTYEYEFIDGAAYQGTADATLQNCDGDFRLYLSAMAESRAKARALRTAFGIGLCSVEEKADATLEVDDDLGPIGDDQIRLIHNLCTKYDIGMPQLLGMLEVPRRVKKLKELTKSEGRELSVKLNSSTQRKRALKS